MFTHLIEETVSETLADQINPDFECALFAHVNL